MVKDMHLKESNQLLMKGFIQSIMPVTGRGIHGPLPDKYDGFMKLFDNRMPLRWRAFVYHLRF
jgi:hypothetical protein